MEVDETDIPHVKVGQKAKLTFDAYPDKKFDGVVTEIGGSPITKSALGTDSSAVNFKVKVQVENPPVEHPARLLGLREDRDRPARRRARDSRSRPSSSPTRRRSSARRARSRRPSRRPSTAAAEKKKDVEGVFVVKKDGDRRVPARSRPGSTPTSRPRSSRGSRTARRSSRGPSRRSACSRSATASRSTTRRRVPTPRRSPEAETAC